MSSTLPMPPRMSYGRRLWTWLCDRVPVLRRYRGSNESASVPDITDAERAKFLALLHDQREAAKLILDPESGGFDAEESH